MIKITINGHRWLMPDMAHIVREGVPLPTGQPALGNWARPTSDIDVRHSVGHGLRDCLRVDPTPGVVLVDPRFQPLVARADRVERVEADGGKFWGLRLSLDGEPFAIIAALRVGGPTTSLTVEAP